MLTEDEIWKLWNGAKLSEDSSSYEVAFARKIEQAAIKHERAEATKLADALMALLGDTQHAKHPSCTDGGYCPVRDAREALEAFNSRIGGAAE